MIKAVIFDYGGVVVREKGPFKKIIAKKLRVSFKEFKKTLRFWFNKWKIAQINEKELWANTLKDLNRNFRIDILKKEIRNQRINNSVIGIVKDIKKKGKKVAILSNTGKEWFNDQKKKFGLDRLFDLIVVSFEEGTAKPEKMFYEIAAKRLGIEPKECVFVDDNESNVRAAEKTGMKGIVYKSARDLKKRLKI